MRTLIDLLRLRAEHTPGRRAFTFLGDGEGKEMGWSYADLDQVARTVGARLRSMRMEGGRALLLFPPGLEFISAFFGCLYGGMTAVPAYPPGLNRSLSRLESIAQDAQATVVLTTCSILSSLGSKLGAAEGLARIEWIATDSDLGGGAVDWEAPPVTAEDLALLQYTSGSTGSPRGVMVSHANLLENSRLIKRAFEPTKDSILVSWLPTYHDMGLIGGVLQPIFAGFPCVLLSPAAFIQRPVRWLRAISRHRATVSGGPNFAYDLCVRRVTDEQRAALDLSTWRCAFNGAEPVRADTLKRFAERFGDCGFSWESFYPCYGLAEATLIVTGGAVSAPPVLLDLDKAALERDQVVPCATGDATRALVGCGQALPGEQIAIVDPSSRSLCHDDRVGEIWVAGKSVARGYWRRPDATAEVFGASLGSAAEGPFLRTGDLGFLHEGELFITGRMKDLIIIRGGNHYPQDIESTVQRSHAAARPECGVAISIDVDDEEELAIVQEIEPVKGLDYAEVANAIRRAVAEEHGLQAHLVALVKRGTVPKTSSGKLERRACRARLLSGALDIVHSSYASSHPSG